MIDKDDSLRVAGEEALVRELDARGMKGVASYRMVPKEELQSADKAQIWFEKAGVEGVVAFRVVNDDRRKTYVPSTWTIDLLHDACGGTTATAGARCTIPATCATSASSRSRR